MATISMGVLDLAFAMDCTGSMGGYIAEARDNIIHIVNDVVQRENCDLRLALVEYRDHPPEDVSFVTKKHDFTESAKTMKCWLNECIADGGGDTPEAVADALNDVLNLSWREEATKMCVFITDAPPHGLATEDCEDSFPDGCPDGLDPMNITKELAGKGVSLYIVGCEPSVSDYKDFYLALAEITGGQYVPLKDAKGLTKVIIYGSREQMSLKKLEDEVEKEIKVMTSSGIEINEKELAASMHKRWSDRGEKTQQLMLNEKALESAKNSANASAMAKMGFDGVRSLFASSVRDSNKESGKIDISKSGDIDGRDAVEEISKAEKVAKVTSALEDLKISRKSLSESWVKLDNVDAGELAQTVDFGPAEKEASTTEEGSGYQCIDGSVSMSQTMRVIQKSMMKMSRSGKSDK